MPWQAQLDLDYERHGERTVLRHRHSGPLRIFQSLYPEGPATCHNVVVHPPGGLAGGDTLQINARLAAGTHALVSTPGAARFYRSDQDAARQLVNLQLDQGARLEWLPLETLAYDGCLAHNHLTLNLAPGAQALLWDVCALGQPAAERPFDTGVFHQRLEVPGVWLEQARIGADDPLLLNSPLGLDGQRCIGTLAFVSGNAMGRDQQDRLLDAVRALASTHPLASRAGATCPNPQVLVLRALGPVVEPVMDLMQKAWGVLRAACWGLPATRPRIWDV